VAYPLVSIVIPCYRQAQYLRDAVDSALAQTYPRVEVIVVDDGSDDETQSVAESYKERVRYYRRPNGGLAAARNHGLSCSSGQFVQFLDADDVIFANKIELQLNALGQEMSSVVSISGYRLLDMDTGRELNPPPMDLGSDPLGTLLREWETGVSIPIHCGLFARDVWGRGPAFDESLAAREDWVMWVMLALKGVRFSRVDAVLAEYRVRRTGMCHDAKRMSVALLGAARIIRAALPENRKKELDHHALDLLVSAVRGGILPLAPDYPTLYARTRAEIDLIKQSRTWRFLTWLNRLRQMGRAPDRR